LERHQAARWVVPVIFALASCTVWAQDVSLLADLAATATPSTTPEPVETLRVPADYASARATMQTFLEAFYADGEPLLDTAAACMDLSGLPAELRTGRGRELAVELKHVLDRTRYVSFEEIPDRAEDPPYVFLRTAEGEVVVARQPDGRWLFTADTVASVDELYRATRGREVVDGVQRQAPEAVTVSMRLREAIPDLLRGRVFLLESWQWLGLLGVLLLGVIAARMTGVADSRSNQTFSPRR